MPFINIIHGTGTENDPYLIENADCLKEYLANEELTIGKYFKQTADITLNDTSNIDLWELNPPSYMSPGNSNGGYYDGDNHTIYGIYKLLNSSTATYDSASERYICGTFVNRAMGIKNLRIADSLLLSNNSFTIIKNIKVSGICGELYEENVVDNCIFEGSVRINDYNFKSCYISGIVSGRENREDKPVTIKNCKNKGKFYLYKSYNTGYALCFGGISARASGAYDIIENCSNYSDFEINENTVGFESVTIGGIYSAWTSLATVKNSFNVSKFEFPNIDCNLTYLSISGIIAGVGGSLYKQPSAENCYNTGEIHCEYANKYTQDTFTSLSGVMFTLDRSADGIATNCYNYADITCVNENTSKYITPIGCSDSGSSGNYTVPVSGSDETSTKVTVLSKQEFSLISSFSNFDFVNTWIMKGGRPRLQSNLEVSRFIVKAESNNINRGITSGSGAYDEDSSATLSAFPYSGFTFKGWSDGNKLNPRVITVSNDITLKAMFLEEGQGFNLLDYDGLAYLWNRIKSWFSSTESGKGASTIGIEDSAGIISSTNVEGAIAETKTIADSNALDVDFIKNNYIKRSPTDVEQIVKITNGTESYSLVVSGAYYSPDTQYYILNGSVYDFANIRPVSCAEVADFDSSLKYYEINAVTGDYVYVPISDQQEFDEKKTKLYYVFEYTKQKSFEQCITERIIYTKNSSGSSTGDWNSTSVYPSGLPHTALVNVNWGYDNGGTITDVTTGQVISHCLGRDKYGNGDIMATFLGVKGHSYRCSAHASPRGDGKWGFIVITFFGD